MKEPTFEDVSKLLRADFETGKLYWLHRPAEMFETLNAFRTWNTRFAGKEAFVTLVLGYLHGRICGRRYKAHRVIWLLATGEWPADVIDHVNGNPSDNRLINLRAVSSAENSKNRRLNANNKSGVMGVHWNEPRGKWTARIRFGGRYTYLGDFIEFKSAVAARKAAEVKFGFSKFHGRAG